MIIIINIFNIYMHDYRDVFSLFIPQAVNLGSGLTIIEKIAVESTRMADR